MEKTVHKKIKIPKRADVKPVLSTSGKVKERGRDGYIANKSFSDSNCEFPQSSITQNI